MTFRPFLHHLTSIALAGAIGWITLGGVASAEETKITAAPTPSLEQRVAGLEAYLTNGDPTISLKDKEGKILAPGLTTPSVGTSGPGHNAWMMTSSALVLFMTLPGLALFYGGLVRKKNVLSVLAQCLGIAGLVTVLWWAVGYSFVFGKNLDGTLIGKLIGGTEYFFLNHVDSAPNPDYSYWVSQNIFAMYQLMFAIITPALIIGAIAERMKFSSLIAFVTVWMFLVYFPLAHMIWGINGAMNGVWNPTATVRAIDFAGGTVVHMSSGWSALILCLILGPRVGFGREKMAPHSMVLCMVGTGMLWVGWYGFNAGSALAADGIAANAFMTTTLASAVACSAWGVAEYFHAGKSSVLGFCSGAVAGLVVITPATGFVNPTGAMIIGVAAGLIPFFAVVKLKRLLGYDDALDTFGVHAVGGTLGALLTGFLATPTVNPNLALSTPANPATLNGLAVLIQHHALWLQQLAAMALTIVLAVGATTLIAFTIKAVNGLRPTREVELQGLDINEHGEEGYLLD